MSSTLGRTSAGRAYQLWALAGGRIVSLGLLGVDPNAYSVLGIAPNITELMVTVEPEGGTVAPTTPVLVQGSTAT